MSSKCLKKCFTELAAELEASLLASGLLDDGERPWVAPPASKRAVNALREEVVTTELLAELGADFQCPICR